MRKILDVEEICRKLKPVFGKKIEQIYLKYRMSQSLEEKQEIEQALNSTINIRNGNGPFPK